MAKDWKDRLGVVFSTNPDYNFVSTENDEKETLLPQHQNLRISLDKKARKGKIVTLISGFIGNDNDLNELAKFLKTNCGVGGSVKDGEIIIQGNFLDKIVKLVIAKGYKTKAIG